MVNYADLTKEDKATLFCDPRLLIGFTYIKCDRDIFLGIFALFFTLLSIKKILTVRKRKLRIVYSSFMTIFLLIAIIGALLCNLLLYLYSKRGINIFTSLEELSKSIMEKTNRLDSLHRFIMNLNIEKDLRSKVVLISRFQEFSDVLIDIGSQLLNNTLKNFTFSNKTLKNILNVNATLNKYAKSLKTLVNTSREVLDQINMLHIKIRSLTLSFSDIIHALTKNTIYIFIMVSCIQYASILALTILLLKKKELRGSTKLKISALSVFTIWFAFISLFKQQIIINGNFVCQNLRVLEKNFRPMYCLLKDKEIYNKAETVYKNCILQGKNILDSLLHDDSFVANKLPSLLHKYYKDLNDVSELLQRKEIVKAYEKLEGRDSLILDILVSCSQTLINAQKNMTAIFKNDAEILYTIRNVSNCQFLNSFYNNFKLNLCKKIPFVLKVEFYLDVSIISWIMCYFIMM